MIENSNAPLSWVVDPLRLVPAQPMGGAHQNARLGPAKEKGPEPETGATLRV